MKKRIFIIEDDHDLANLFRIALEMCGFEVSAYHDGRQGLEALEEPALPDGVMLDMHLPAVSGAEILAWMEKRGESRRVLLCSADVQLMEHYRAQGVKVLVKPASVEDIQRCMTELVQP